MKNVKIINKYKFTRAILVLLLIIGVVLWIFNRPSYSNRKKKYKIEYIAKGETLLEIAQKQVEQNMYFKNQDIRNVILEIKTLNQMTTSDITEGMEIKIPIY